MGREDSEDYRSILQHGAPLLDTRSPIEFSRGAFPGAVNLPLMNDAERHEIGIRYKEAGQAAAIELGHELVQGELREQRIAAWCQFARDNPGGYLYCFRGGLRSNTAQQWMREAGIDYPLVRGGYKAMRRFLIDELLLSVAQARLVLIGGKTGTGKTRVIDALARQVDLEGLANHRGSSFGHLVDPQPSQIDFENALSIGFMRLLAAGEAPIVLEDEGRLVGRLALPEQLREKMQSSALLLVEEPVVQRVQVIYEDYVLDLQARYRARHGAAGDAQHRQQLLDGLARIQRRLGGELYQQIEALMQQAFAAEAALAESLHRQWIEALLLQYYDPMYDYQMGKREGEVLRRGNRAEITAAAAELSGGLL
ncbi:MAG: tRNA 2-selenouridine(34) synthase MnmH [Halieaceae bacterium]